MTETHHEPRNRGDEAIARLRDRVARHPWVAAAVVFACAVAPFAGTLRGGFVSADRRTVEDNPIVERGLAGLDPLELLRADVRGQSGDQASGSYRPLTVATLVVDAVVGDGAPWTFHLTNLWLHGLAAALAFWVLRRRFGDPLAALLSALFFAVHAVHTENVANIVGRADVLATALGLLAWDAWRRSWRGAIGGALLLLAALLAGEVAIGFVAVLLWETVTGWRRDAWKGWAVRWAGAIVAVGGYLSLRVWALGAIATPQVLPSANPLAEAGAEERALTVLTLFARAAGLLVTPAELSADYSFAEIVPVADPWHLEVWLGWAFAVLVVVAAWRWRRRRPCASVGLVLLAATYAAFCNLFALTSTIFAERLLYLPSLGLCLAVGRPLVQWWTRRGLVVAVVIAAVAALHVGRAATRAEDWLSEASLWSATVVTSPSSAVAWYHLGDVELNANRPERAARDLARAVATDPGFVMARTNLGVALERTGRSEEAGAELAHAFEDDPRCSRCALNLSAYYAIHHRRSGLRWVVERHRHAGGDAGTQAQLEARLRSLR